MRRRTIIAASTTGVLSSCATVPARLEWLTEFSTFENEDPLNLYRSLSRTDLVKIAEFTLTGASGSLSSELQAPIAGRTLRESIMRRLQAPAPTRILISDIAGAMKEVSLRDASKWKIDESTDDKITTVWSEVQGRRAGLLVWEKEYFAEARHHISIVSSLYSSSSRLSLRTEVRERPNENYSWREANPELARSQHSSLVNLIILVIDTHKKRNVK